MRLSCATNVDRICDLIAVLRDLRKLPSLAKFYIEIPWIDMLLVGSHVCDIKEELRHMHALEHFEVKVHWDDVYFQDLRDRLGARVNSYVDEICQAVPYMRKEEAEMAAE